MTHVIVITGASSGIGKALAEHYLKNGHKVGLLARSKDKLDAIATAFPDTAIALPCDVTDPGAVSAAITTILDTWTHIDLLIANSGIALENPAKRYEAQITKNVFDVNFFGALYAIEAVLPSMIKRKSGHIVGISSLASFTAAPSAGAYSASKGAMNLMFDSFRRSLGRDNIVFSTICPGFIKTPLTAKNRFSMPGLMELDAATQKIVAAIKAKKQVYIFPKHIYWLICILRFLPVSLQDRIMAKNSYRKWETKRHNW